MPPADAERSELNASSTVHEVLQELRRRNVQLSVEDDRLIVSAPPDALSAPMREILVARKADLMAFLHAARDAADTTLAVEHVPPGLPAPLTFAQQRFWFLHELDPANAAYHIGVAIALPDAISDADATAALHGMARKHDILRTIFAAHDGVPMQTVTEALPPLPTVTIDGPDAEARARDWRRVHDDVTRAPFNLVHAPPIRAALVRMEGAPPVMLIVVHHIVADGPSLGIIAHEIRARCWAPRDAAVSADQTLPWQFADYALGQQRSFAKSDRRADEEFWLRSLGGMPPAIQLPVDRARRRSDAPQSAAAPLAIPAEAARALRTLCAASGGTTFTGMHALLKMLLARYCGETDIVVGTPVTTRTRVELEPMIGPFVNTLVLRTDLSPDPSFRDLLRQMHAQTLEALAHQDYPFERIVSLVRPDRTLAQTPLFQVAYIYQVAPGAQAAAPDTGAVPPVSTLGGGAPFELALYVWDTGDGIAGTFEYRADLFDARTVARMATHLVRLAAAATASPDTPVASLQMMDDDELRALLVDWNNTATEYPRNDPAHVVFERQADATPNAVAVVAPPSAPGGTMRTLTYTELEQRANRLARQLRILGVRAPASVAIALERSPEFIIAMLATLKLGATYVPVDPNLPGSRQLAMLQDASCCIVIARAAWRDDVPDVAVPFVPADDFLAPVGGRDNPRESQATPADSPAYLMFTSGSSGRPKAVAVPHRGIVRLVCNTNYVQLGATDAILACAPVSFDASTFELWGALLTGGRVVLYPAAVPEAAAVGTLIREHRITTLWLTAGLFHHIVDVQPDALAPLRYLLAGGDVLSPSHVRQTLQALTSGTLINGYGPTENTTFTCCHAMTRADDVGEVVPIGRPIANTRAYVLNALAPVPIGAVGELWAAGDGVALGYAGDAELAAAKFAHDPFANDERARMYRTGDMVRHREDGALEFLGRNDSQVKIRGFRIELGEVENALSSIPGVAAAAAIAVTDAREDKRLVGFYVSATGLPLDPATLRAALRARLPEYLVPSVLAPAQALPTTSRGKIDRAALARAVPAVAARQARPPMTTIEHQIVQIWESLLDVRPIGIQDDFFDVGGHSLLAVRMLADVERVTGRRVPLATLFEFATIERLAALVEHSVFSEAEPPLVVLQQGGTRPPVVLLHGDVRGGGWYARRLMALVDSDMPCFVLPTLRPERAGSASTVEAMAQKQIDSLKAVQPRGPYRLVGYCAGGLVAFEMARRLVANGDQVERLVLIDAPVENARSRAITGAINTITLGSVSRASVERRSWFMQTIWYYSHRIAGLRAGNARARWAWMRGFVARRLKRRRTAPGPPSAAASAPSQEFQQRPGTEVLRHQARASNAYVPGRYDGRVDIIVPTGAQPESLASAAVEMHGSADLEYTRRAWRNVAKQVQVHGVAASHVGIITDRLADLAARLRERLD